MAKPTTFGSEGDTRMIKHEERGQCLTSKIQTSMGCNTYLYIITFMLLSKAVDTKCPDRSQRATSSLLNKWLKACWVHSDSAEHCWPSASFTAADLSYLNGLTVNSTQKRTPDIYMMCRCYETVKVIHFSLFYLIGYVQYSAYSCTCTQTWQLSSYVYGQVPLPWYI